MSHQSLRPNLSGATHHMPSPSVTSPQVALNDIGSAEDFLAAIDKTIKYFNDGDIVEGTIVKVDRDEVLLDIGYKTEGVIPSRELSIKHDVDPADAVSVGAEVEALVLQKEDKEGGLILSKKRAQYEPAWCTSPSCPGSTSITPARWSKSARRSRSRSSTSTWTASGCRCRSRPPRKTRGASSPGLTRSGRSCPARSPSWCPSARSSVSR